MWKTIGVTLAAALVAVPLYGELVTQEIEYTHDDTTMQGYLAWDNATDEKRPGILVVHEWWGHNAYARKRTEQLANMGYIAMAIDMYGDGKVAEHPDDAGAFATAVFQDLDEATERFKAAMQVLTDHPISANGDLAAIGYCFGGGIVLHMARTGVDLDGVASFHGSLQTEHPAQPGEVKARILVCHGANDQLVPDEQVAAFEQEMDAAGADYIFKSYPGAAHSFTNPGATDMGERFGLPLAYDKAADKASWADLSEFLESLF